MKFFFLLILFFTVQTLVCQESSSSCSPCDNKGIENFNVLDSLEYNQTKEFLCVIQKKCLKNKNFKTMASSALKKLICQAPNVFLMVIAINKVDEESLLEILKTEYTPEEKTACKNALQNASFTTLKVQKFMDALNA